MNSSTEVTGRPLLLTVNAAAGKLGVSASMIRTLMERRTLPKIKLTDFVKGQLLHTTTAAIEALAAASSPVVRLMRTPPRSVMRPGLFSTRCAPIHPPPKRKLRPQWPPLTSHRWCSPMRVLNPKTSGSRRSRAAAAAFPIETACRGASTRCVAPRTVRGDYMKENENIRRMSSADLIELLDDEDCSEEERSAAVEAIKERAAKVGVGFVRYVQDTKDGKQPRQPVPFVKFASGGDGVGAECSAYLMRPDILEYVELPLALVEAVLKKLAKKDPEVAGRARRHGGPGLGARRLAPSRQGRHEAGSLQRPGGTHFPLATKRRVAIGANAGGRAKRRTEEKHG